MVEAEQLHAFVKVEQAFGDIVQAEEFFVTAIKLAHTNPRTAKLLVKSVAKARADMQQRKESGRIQSAAMPEAAANQMVVVGGDGLQNVQQSDRRLKQRNGATDQACAIAIIAALECFLGARGPSSNACALHQ